MKLIYYRIVFWVYFALTSFRLYGADEHGEVNLMDPSKDMAIWTWVTFGFLLLVLYKFAWNPILSGLDKREKDIRESVENAEKIRTDLQQIEGKREQLIKEADDKAKEIVTTARKAAVEASKVIENKAKDEAKIVLENANREITAAKEKAEAMLRKDSADLAIALSSKLIGENLDNEKNRILTDKLIDKI